MLTKPHARAICANARVHAEELRNSELVYVEHVLACHWRFHVHCRGTVGRHSVLESCTSISVKWKKVGGSTDQLYLPLSVEWTRGLLPQACRRYSTWRSTAGQSQSYIPDPKHSQELVEMWLAMRRPRISPRKAPGTDREKSFWAESRLKRLLTGIPDREILEGDAVDFGSQMAVGRQIGPAHARLERVSH